MDVSVTIEGLDELDRAWAEAVRTVDVGMRHGVSAACAEGATEARDTHLFQNRTGALEDSIRAVPGISTPGAATGEIRASKGYASYVDGGTSRSRADGFMGRAYQKAERVLEREVEVAVEKAASIVSR